MITSFDGGYGSCIFSENGGGRKKAMGISF